MHKFTRLTFKVLDLFVIFMMTFGAPFSALAAPSPTGATIASDLPDYAPGATVTLTGAGWAAGESVHVFVNDDIGQQWSLDSNPDPVADGSGNFTYQFDLPDLFVATYSVTATGATSGTATTTFTDAIPNSVKMVTWRTSGSGAWIEGTLNQNNSNYKEGETVPFRIELGTLATNGNPYSAAICRDYQTGTVFGYTQLLPFNTSRAATPGGTITSLSTVGAWPAGTFQGVNITITGVTETGGPGACGGTQRETIVTFTSSGSGPQYLLWGGRLSTPTDPGVGFGNSASFYPGGSLQMRLESPDKTAGINPSGIIQLAKLTVTKVVDSGSATPDQWCFTVTGPNSYNSSQCVPSGQSSVDFIGLNTGAYTVTESSVAGYAFVSGEGTNCTFSGSTATGNVTAAAGGATNASCTFHNALQQGTLTVIKHVVTDNGGTATADQWSIHVKSGANEVSGSPQAGSESGTSYTLTGGSYTVSETGGPSGYTFTGFSGDCDSSGNVTVVAGQNKTCTLTNDDQTAHLKLVKVVVNDNGGSATEAAWTLSASGPTPLSGPGPVVESDVNAGTYNLSESGPGGYSTTGYDCGSSVSLALGESKTCTITNDDQQAYVTVVKVVHNNHGGTAAPDDFSLTLNGNAVTSGVAVPVAPGTYTAGETQLSGYTFDGFSGDCDSNGQITVALGESKTCTLTNSDQAATITVVKVVNNNHGGTAGPDDFLLTLNGNSVSSGVAVEVTPGTYTAGETLLPGYTFDGFSGDCSSSGDITVALGESKTCTLTNSDKQSYVIVNKVVINDNGGSADPDDFSLTLDGNATTSGAPIPVNPGTYTAGETQLSGYTFEGFSGDCDDTGSVTVALGETKTCTLTNNDQQAYITVVKVVNNDHGGTAAPDDFNLTLDGNPVSSGVAVPVDPGTYTASETLVSGYTFGGFSGDCDDNGAITVALGESKTCTLTNSDKQSYVIVEKVVVNDNGGSAKPDDFNLTLDGNATTSGTPIPVDPGTYTAGETQLSGYTFEGFSGDCDSNGSVTVALGETKTCTLTNNDKQAYVIVEKVVVNDNGGSAKPDDFNLTLDGNATTSGTPIPVDPGTYTAGETQLSGYTFEGFSGDCDSNGSVTVALGETKTCTLTNDDQQAYVTVVKVVNNDHGGTASPDDFNLTLEGNAVSNGIAVPVDPGTYTAGETQLSGYTFDGFSGDCDDNGDVTVALGESKTCTLTNSDQQAYITVVKVVNNNYGGTAQPNDFHLTLEGNAVSSGVAVPVNPGTYTAGETQLSGYTFDGFSGGCDTNGAATVALGESKTCTLTNSDIQPKLTLVKTVINDNGGTKTVADFPLFVDTTSVTSGVANGFDAGSYVASETTQTGYAASAWGGDCAADGSVTLNIGDNKTCTITNNDIQPKLTLVKTVINNNGGTKTVADFPLFVNTTSVTSGVANGFDAGSYTASETSQYGYAASSWGGDCAADGSVTLSVGDNKTCTITNDDIQPKLTLVKTVINDNGGTKQVSDFPLFVNTTSVTSGVANGFNAGSYTASETSQYGYTASAWGGDCAANGSVTLSVGDNKTCTITNDDQPGTIIIKKIVKGTNLNTSFSYTTTGTGYTNFSLSGGTQNSQTVNAGGYTVTELVPLGWVLTGIGGSTDPLTPYACTVTGSGGSSGSGDLNTMTASITLKNGDTVTCVFENTGPGVTRTQGFWATHPQLAEIAWFGGTAFGHTFPGVANTAGIGDATLCGRPIDTLGKLMGAFWSDISKKSTGAKRSALDQARMQLLQQLLAAELNASAFGSVPSSGTFAAWESAYCGTNQNNIKNAQQQAASFNSQGDNSTFTPGTSADSKTARAGANYTFWDVLP